MVINAQTLPPAELGGLSFTNTQPERMLVAQADQAQMLVRHLRGDLDGYPGFIWK